MSLPAASLAEYGSAELAQWLRNSDSTDWHRIIVAELERRDQADAHTRTSAAVAVREQRFDGAQVLGYARAFIDRYARMPSDAAADVIALWAAHAHCREAGGTLLFENSPRLMLLSSEPGSGKSRVLGLARMLCGGRYGLLTEPTAVGTGAHPRPLARGSLH